MTVTRIDGKALAEQLREDVAEGVRAGAVTAARQVVREVILPVCPAVQPRARAPPLGDAAGLSARAHPDPFCAPPSLQRLGNTSF